MRLLTAAVGPPVLLQPGNTALAPRASKPLKKPRRGVAQPHKEFNAVMSVSFDELPISYRFVIDWA
jgi:hypothetical protein